ncbi:type II secretion system F family protein [Citreimonas salinaria]|uniref:Flp pilus assembly protein TadB n=1 Tax=Citreimonas salinaria TaxID=321339 RepID=A0A1H3LZW3_9RHOB|nr:type II secretion system F family protein [Citreimonas salinaria]SDY69982.1 Flp pilus assembly protein TadB [Citreimonas salinaria]
MILLSAVVSLALVLVLALVAIGPIKRARKSRRLASRLLKNDTKPAGVSPPPPPVITRDPDLENSGSSFKLPILSRLVESARYGGLGRLAWPAVVGVFVLTWPLSNKLPLDHVPKIVSLFVAFVIVNSAARIVFGMLASRKRARIEAEIPVFLDAVARGLSVGKSFTACLESATENLGPEMSLAVREISAGMSAGFLASELFEEQARKHDIGAFLFVAAVVAASERSGGSMTAAVRNLSGVVRSQRDLKLKVKALAAQGKAGGYIIGLMPLGMMLVMSGVQPKMIEHLFSNMIGNLVFCLILALVYMCFATVNKIANMKV